MKYNFFTQKKEITWQVTPDTWHLTPDMWHGGGVNLLSKCQLSWFGIYDILKIGRKRIGYVLNEWINQ